MSDVSVLERHFDLVLTLIIVGTLGVLSAIGILEITLFSPQLAAIIFTFVIVASISSFAIFATLDEVVSNAKEKELISIIRKVFYWPIVLSITGLLLAVSASIFRVESTGIEKYSVVFSAKEWASLLLFGIFVYAIMSFREVFRVVYYATSSTNTD